jgi:hypothetical protein
MARKHRVADYFIIGKKGKLIGCPSLEAYTVGDFTEIKGRLWQQIREILNANYDEEKPSKLTRLLELKSIYTHRQEFNNDVWKKKDYNEWHKRDLALRTCIKALGKAIEVAKILDINIDVETETTTPIKSNKHKISRAPGGYYDYDGLQVGEVSEGHIRTENKTRKCLIDIEFDWHDVNISDTDWDWDEEEAEYKSPYEIYVDWEYSDDVPDAFQKPRKHQQKEE